MVRNALRTIFIVVALLTLLIAQSNAQQSTLTQTEDADVRWQNVQIEIGRLTSLQHQFYVSFCTFVQQHCVKNEEDFYLVNQDLNEPVQGVKVVHIKGDLNTDVAMTDHGELVIAGDVSSDSTIYAQGISKIFVGGDVLGNIESLGSTDVFVMGHFKGTLRTGSPGTSLVIKKNFEGIIQPNIGRGALLSINVAGYASEERITSIYEQDYTQINGFFGTSEMRKGVYRQGNKNLTILQ